MPVLSGVGDLEQGGRALPPAAGTQGGVAQTVGSGGRGCSDVWEPRGFPGCETFGAETGKVLGELGQVAHPTRDSWAKETHWDHSPMAFKCQDRGWGPPV